MHSFPSDKSFRQTWILTGKISSLANLQPSVLHTLMTVAFKGIPLFDDCGKTNMQKRYLIRGSIPSKDMADPYTTPLTSRFSLIPLRVF